MRRCVELTEREASMVLSAEASHDQWSHWALYQEPPFFRRAWRGWMRLMPFDTSIDSLATCIEVVP